MGNKRLGEKGQALLIVVLVMVVSATVGLSLASRTVTTLKTSTEEENSQRAFSAAEAGVERALQTGTGIAQENPIDATTAIKEVNIQAVSGTEFLVNGGSMNPQDDAVEIWLSDIGASYDNPTYDNPWTGSLSIHWGTLSDACSSDVNVNTTPAIQLAIITGSKASPRVGRYGFDPCEARRSSNQFSAPETGVYSVSSRTFAYRATISVSSGLIVRAIPLYANASIGARGTVSLPSQGRRIESVGKSGDTQRKIQVFETPPLIPSEFFPYILLVPRS